MDSALINVQSLLDVAQGQPAEVRKLCQLFIHSMKSHLQKLNRAVESRDADQLKFIAHTAAGASDLIGMKGIAKLLKQLEGLANQQDLAAAKVLMPTVRKSFSELCVVLDSLDLSPSPDPKRSAAQPQ